jgi:hypothetical protein
MARWTCPRCDREFAAARQAHTCAPGGSVEDSFSGPAARFRAAYDAVVAHLETLGPIHEDAVTVGVFLKSDRKIAELRPRARSLALMLSLPRTVEDPRITRVVSSSPGRVFHLIPLRSPDDVDDQVRAWLTEAFWAATDG